jgi:hypothetical protein
MGDEIRISFRKAEGYKLVPATGAWGGVTPQGEIVFDLYVERKQFPQHIVMVRQESGGYKEDEDRKEEGAMVREAQVGVVLRPDIAYQIGKWLMETAKKAGVQELRVESQAVKH